MLYIFPQFKHLYSDFKNKHRPETIDQGENTTSQEHILSRENKYIRFKVNDLLAHTHIQMILIKIWKLWLELQQNSSQYSIFTKRLNTVDKSTQNTSVFKAMLHLGVYSEIIPLLKKGYGVYYDTDYYVTKKPEYRKDYIKFERFSFDIISLVGENLLKITPDEFELLLRKTFHSITFSQDGKLKF